MLQCPRIVPALVSIAQAFMKLIGPKWGAAKAPEPSIASSKGHVHVSFFGQHYEKEWSRKADFRSPPRRRRR
jgi:hypothetical protein